MNAIGIVQGRLSPPIGECIQAFPIQTWREEFEKAAIVGLDCIEWIYELNGSALNPITSSEGIREVRTLSEKSGVSVRSLCADYLMDQPLLRVADADVLHSSQTVVWLLGQCSLASIQHLVIPFVGLNAIWTEEEAEQAVEQIKGWLLVAEKFNVEMHLETSLDPCQFRQLLEAIAHPLVKVTYDIGNSLQFGFTVSEEFDSYGYRIGSVHVKDSKRRGTTVRLGTGDANFEYCFRRLAKIGYQGDYILQAARVPGMDEVALAREYVDFVHSQLPTGE